jgi:hypothetical protein
VDDDDDDIIEIIESDPVEIGPAPWHNSDTVAASFAFASNVAAAAAMHFSQLSFLALGQSLEEWAEREQYRFARDASEAIRLLTKESGDGGETSG